MSKHSEDRREARRKRRVRNQIFAYIVLVLIIVMIGFAGYKGIKLLIGKIKHTADTPIVTEESVASVVSENETQVIATPDYDLTESSEEEVVIEEVPVENAAAKAYVDGLTTEQKVASLFIVTPESITGVTTATQAGEGTKTALSKYMVGGIIYASKNALGADKFKELISNTKNMYSELYGCDLWVAVNEEGAVNTIAGGTCGVTKEKTAKEIGESGDNNNAYVSYVNIGTYLADYDVDIDIAPVCDVKTNDNGFIGDRAFSNDADIAASMVKNAVNGLKEQGVKSCVSAFPGQGEATTNPANGVCNVEKTLDDMKTTEFVPFAAAIEAETDMVMMSNIMASNATGEAVPCSLSAAMINSLKNELGFEGIVVSGYLDDKAITGQYSQGEVAVMAINAGCDMLLRPANFEEAYNAVIEAVNNGTITEERLNDALMKIYSKKF